MKMSQISTYTYKQGFNPNCHPMIFEMAKESGKIYTKALSLNRKRKNFKEINEIMQKYCKNNCKYLHSQSAQASYQSFIICLKAYFKALKAYQKNPSKFSGKPMPPKRNKFLYKITFKKSAIRYKNNYLFLSLKRGLKPIKLKWNAELPIPVWVIINYDRFEGWCINYVMEKKCKYLKLNPDNAMSIDLGVKRVATTFDSVTHDVITYNGKELMSLARLRNKVDGTIKSKKSKCKKGSRKFKKLKRSKRKIVKRIKNKENNILNKYSRQIVNDVTNKNIGTIVIGDNASTHKNTNLGKNNNQKITQGVEQKLCKQIQYKFERVGGATEVVPEPYTSRTCPRCGNIKLSSPNGRTYTCKKCGFVYDRDGVGSINIMKNNININVSFAQKWADVVGGLTPPKGVKYSPGLSPNQHLNKVKKRILKDYSSQETIDSLSVLNA